MVLDYTEIIIAIILGGWNTLQHFQIKKCQECPLFIKHQAEGEKHGNIQLLEEE
jgi:hypothetical protein